MNMSDDLEMDYIKEAMYTGEEKYLELMALGEGEVERKPAIIQVVVMKGGDEEKIISPSSCNSETTS